MGTNYLPPVDFFDSQDPGIVEVPNNKGLSDLTLDLKPQTSVPIESYLPRATEFLLEQTAVTFNKQISEGLEHHRRKEMFVYPVDYFLPPPVLGTFVRESKHKKKRRKQQ